MVVIGRIDWFTAVEHFIFEIIVEKLVVLVRGRGLLVDGDPAVVPDVVATVSFGAIGAVLLLDLVRPGFLPHAIGIGHRRGGLENGDDPDETLSRRRSV